MTKRQLTEQEKGFVKKNINVITNELEYSEAELKRQVVTLETAPIIYKKQIRLLEGKRIEAEDNVKEMKNALVELNRQLKEGVEVKEKVDAEQTK